MPYTLSKAQSGNGSVLSINTGTASSPTLIPVGEITDLAQSGKTNKTDDVTNLASVAEEFLPTLLSPGKWAITMNRVSGDAGQVALLASFNALPPTMMPYTITLPKTPTQTVKGDTFSFSAMVEEFNDVSSVKPDKKVTTTASLKVSGAITLTVGS